MKPSRADQLAAAEEPAAGIASRVATLHRFTDAMLEARYLALMKKVEHAEKLTRTELQKKQEENRKLAQEGFADRLKKEAANSAAPFANWLLAERLWIELRLERDLAEIAAECWSCSTPHRRRPTRTTRLRCFRPRLTNCSASAPSSCSKTSPPAKVLTRYSLNGCRSSSTSR